MARKGTGVITCPSNVPRARQHTGGNHSPIGANCWGNWRANVPWLTNTTSKHRLLDILLFAILYPEWTDCFMHNIFIHGTSQLVRISFVFIFKPASLFFIDSMSIPQILIIEHCTLFFPRSLTKPSPGTHRIFITHIKYYNIRECYTFIENY